MRILLTILIAFILFSSCKKSVSSGSDTEKTVEANLINGPCPYNCHDTRCQAYANGYCGPASPPPNQLSTSQFISLTGTIHNNGLTYLLSNINFNLSNSSYASAVTNGISGFYNLWYNGMTIDAATKSRINSSLVTIYNNIEYWGNNNTNTHPFDSAISSQINQIAPTRSTNEKNQLNNALNIFNFNHTGMSTDAIYDTVINRANTVYSTYINTTWPANTGDCIGGYVNIVLNSAYYWKYVYDNNGTPPAMVAGGGGSLAVMSIATLEDSTARNWNPITWFKGLLAPESDALGYLVGWGHAYFIAGVDDPNTRIKEGLSSAVGFSVGKLAN